MTHPITAHSVAQDIDRLAYIIDPYEYFDVVGRTEEDIEANVQHIEDDLLSGNFEQYIEWLQDIIDGSDTDFRDCDRAKRLLSRLHDWIYNHDWTVA